MFFNLGIGAVGPSCIRFRFGKPILVLMIFFLWSAESDDLVYVGRFDDSILVFDLNVAADYNASKGDLRLTFEKEDAVAKKNAMSFEKLTDCK